MDDMPVRAGGYRPRSAGIEVPRLPDYSERLMDYAVAADWGRSASAGAGPSSVLPSGFSAE